MIDLNYLTLINSKHLIFVSLKVLFPKVFCYLLPHFDSIPKVIVIIITMQEPKPFSKQNKLQSEKYNLESLPLDTRD